jgi:hypothetical protein
MEHAALARGGGAGTWKDVTLEVYLGIYAQLAFYDAAHPLRAWSFRMRSVPSQPSEL